jgi:RNA polymerase sigma-70 factor (ECF subfamily)
MGNEDREGVPSHESWAALFLQSLDGEMRRQLALRSSDIDTVLGERIRRCRGVWPEIRLDVAVFVRRLAQALGGETDPLDQLMNLHVEDLYFAMGCASGDPNALDAFRREWVPAVRHTIARSVTAPTVDDVCQLTLTKLLVAEEGGPARIARYSGRGQLRHWLRTVATREAHSYVRKKQPHPVDPDDALLVERAITDGDDPELAIMKRRYRAEFKQAFAHAFAKLSVRKRNLLRHELIDGLSGDQIGALYRVHRSTIARWRAEWRSELFAHTRDALAARLDVPSGTAMESLVRLIDSQLDVSLLRLLREAETE